MISVVFPTYNEEGNVLELHARLKKTLDDIGEPYEIIATDGPSTDNTLPLLKTLSPIKIIVFARNMGPASALDAGIKATKGDKIVIIDADLQSNPEDIPKLLKKLNEGYDVVSGRRLNRKYPFHRRLISRCANFLIRSVTGIKLQDFGSQFKMCKKEALEDIMLYGGMHAFLHVIPFMRGFKVAEVPVENNERKFGKTKYSLFRVAKIFVDLMVVKFFADYFAQPLMFFGGWGIVSILLGFVSGGISIILKLLEIRTFTQTPLPTLTALLIVVGVLLVMMGFLAEILFRIYYENKGRTPYNIKEIIENK